MNDPKPFLDRGVRGFDPSAEAYQSTLGRIDRRRRNRRISSALVALVIALAIIGPVLSHLSGRAGGESAPADGAAGKIAFNSDRSGVTEIYVMNADGSGQTNVSHGAGDITDGAWSPDGSRIAFTSDRGGNRNIYVVNADGSGLTNVSNDPCGAFLLGGGLPGGQLGWSPDGSRIAFSSGQTGSGGGSNPGAGDCGSTIKVVNADGSGLTDLTNGPGSCCWSYDGWSPDGSRFAFTSDRDGNIEIYVVNADGSGLTNVSNDPGFNNFSDNPGNDGSAWSPDGSRVSFISSCKVVGGKVDLNVVNADGSGLTYAGHPDPMVNGGWTGCDASFDPNGPPISGGYNPDGAHVAFLVALGHHNGEEVYVMNADGSGVTRLTHNNVDDSNVVSSPDGSLIAFHRNGDIYVINAVGSGLTNLSNDPGDDFLADGGWSSDSSRIAFVSSRDGNGEIYLVNADGSGLTNLTDNPGNDSYPIWSPAR